jgi:hypothetical protein
MKKIQKEALKKVFAAYESWVVMSSGDNSIFYAKDVLDTIPKLAKAFPKISLENDELGLYKNMYGVNKEN